MTVAAVGSGHSAYGVGLALPQTRFTVAPCDTSPALASVSVLPAMLVITRVTFSRLACGTVSVKPSGKTLASATVIVVEFVAAPVTVDWRGGQAPASRTTHDFGRFSTPF